MNPEAAWELDRPHSTAMQREHHTKEAQRFLCYTSCSRAVEHSLYNGILMSLFGLLHLAVSPSRAQHHVRLADQTAKLGHASANTCSCLLPVGEILDMHGAAMEIVRAFEHQLLHKFQRRHRALSWLLPLGLAYQVLIDEPDWTAWIERMQSAAHESRGYGRTEDTAEWWGYLPLPVVTRGHR